MAMWEPTHIDIATKVNAMIPRDIELVGIQIEPLVRPMILMGTHIVVDRVGGEGNSQFYHDVALIQVATMFMSTPDKLKPDFIYISAWTMLPDLPIFKQYFHYVGYQPIINMTGEQTAVIDALCVFDYVTQLNQSTDIKLAFSDHGTYVKVTHIF